MPAQRSKRTIATDALVQKAIAGLKDKTYSTPGKAARELGLSKATLNQRLGGGKSYSDAREADQLLSNSEEKALRQWITRLTIGGSPVRHSYLRDMAEEIRSRRVVNINNATMQLVLYDPIGISWVPRFLQRHPQLQTVMSHTIEMSRLRESSV